MRGLPSGRLDGQRYNRVGRPALYALLLLAAVIILLGIIIFLLGRRVYLKSALTLSEAPAKKARARKLSDASSPVKAIFKKEWKSILKTPVYAINSLSGALVLPIMLLVIWMGGSMDMQLLLSQIGYDSSNFSHMALCAVILSAILFFAADSIPEAPQCLPERAKAYGF